MWSTKFFSSLCCHPRNVRDGKGQTDSSALSYVKRMKFLQNDWITDSMSRLDRWVRLNDRICAIDWPDSDVINANDRCFYRWRNKAARRVESFCRRESKASLKEFTLKRGLNSIDLWTRLEEQKKCRKWIKVYDKNFINWEFFFCRPRRHSESSDETSRLFESDCDSTVQVVSVFCSKASECWIARISRVSFTIITSTRIYII